MPVKSAQQKSPIIRNLTGGLNVREAITDIADNEAAAATNVSYYTSGALVRRGAWVKLIANSPTVNALLGGYQAVFNNAGVYTYYTVITDGYKIWHTSNPTASPVVWTEITGTATLDASQPYRFLMMSSKLVIYNGKVAYYWTGTGNLTAFALPTGTYYSLTVGDIALTAVATGAVTITFSYTGGGTAGGEVVTVGVGNAINVKIQDGVSTSDQIVAAIKASGPAAALVTPAVTLSGNPQSVSLASTAKPLANPYITVPLSCIGIVWQNFLFWLGDKNNPSRAYYSDLGDPTLYPAANYIDVPNPFDGEQLTGAAILYGNLMLFKRFSLYILQGSPPDNLILSKLNSTVGCVAPTSMVQIDNLVYFVSDKGLYAANLFNVQQKCYKVEPRYIAAVPASTAANPIWVANYKPKSQIFVACDCRSLYGPSRGQNDRILVHDYFNADANGDPATSEYIVGYTAYGLTATKPNFPTGPSFMSDYFFPGTPGKNVTVMASFYDPYLYTFTDGQLAYGGPADEVSWLPAPTYPQPDWLSKFFDFGDPDMIKQVRWLWTTGQLYNSINLAAGVVYNNSPTAVSFLDMNVDVVELVSPNGQVWTLGVADDGALILTPTTDSTFLGTLVLQDVNGHNWSVGVDDDGALTCTVTGGSATTPPVLASVSGYQYQIYADTDGAIGTLPVFSPAVAPIRPGSRVAVLPIINGVGGAKQGKYIQLYFTGIGILTQFSMDLIFKGRRN